MADEPKAEIMMRFVLKGRGAVKGESQLEIDPADKLSHDFKSIANGHDHSNFFEVQTFDFSMSVEPQDTGIGNMSHGVSGSLKGAASHHNASSPGAAGGHAGAKDGKSSDPWQRWRSATEIEARKLKHSLKFEDFKFTRAVDSTSPIFFQACSTQQRFDSAVLIKRVATGVTGGKKRIGQTFLRFDFTEVLLKGLDWSDGDIVTESATFVCNGLQYTYLEQDWDGSLKPGLHIAIWDRNKDSVRPDDGEK